MTGDRIVLVMDKGPQHSQAVLAIRGIRSFLFEGGLRIAERLEIHYTPNQPTGVG